MSVAVGAWEKYRIRPGSRVALGSVAADEHDLCLGKQEARILLKEYRKEIDDLLATLAAEDKRSILIIFQGMDASGKDGAVRKVFTGVNPQHCKVTSFKEPDREEQAHDYLWRIHRALPARGELGVFNRSQYEDVLVAQTQGELSRKDSHARLRQIADIERIWTENGIVIRKFFLHITRKEQTRRFKARLDTPEKRWKVEKSDFEDRKLWPKFQAVYEEILHRTATKAAPWYVVPADHKWYRDTVIAGVVLATLRAMHPRIPIPKLDAKGFELK
jgi:PPK2 family polyphosphate:nucleotide phosphotransferase